MFNGRSNIRAFEDNDDDRLEITNIGPAYENGVARVNRNIFLSHNINS